MRNTRLESIEAMQSSGAIGCQNERILHYLAEHYPRGFHAAEIATALDMRLTSARARLTTLTQGGAVREEGTVYCSESKRNVTAYSLNSGRHLVEIS